MVVKSTQKETIKNIKRFDKWMRDIVKSKHYSDNDRMLNAYSRLV